MTVFRLSRNRLFGVAAWLAALLIAGGCRLAVNKNADGTDKNVKIDTPIGGLHVRANDITAADVGLPVYPGAQAASGHDGNKSADVHVGFGDWQLRIKVAAYQSPDSRDQIVTFYKKALGRFGDVIVCQGKSAVGSPAVTREGLGCDDSTDGNKTQVEQGDFSLKAGSKRHQRMVAFDKSDASGSHFSLVQIELPSAVDGKGEETN